LKGDYSNEKRILAFLCLITLFVSSITVNAEEIEVGSNESVMAYR